MAWKLCLIGLTFCSTTLSPASALTDDGYLMPPDEIVEILDVPPSPTISIDPTRKWMLLVERCGMPPLKDMAEPMWRLGGSRFNPMTSGPHSARRYVGLTLKNIESGETLVLSGPEDADFGSPVWNAQGTRFAFTHTSDHGIELWVGDVASKTLTRWIDQRLNATTGSPFQWMPDGKSMLCRLVPKDRGSAPEAPLVPKGPVIQESFSVTSPVRTYQDLLKSPYDEACFDWIATQQLALVDEKGQVAPLGSPAIYGSVSASPDGQFILVSRIERPYSYLVTWRSFPTRVEVWDNAGTPVKSLTEIPLQDQVAIGGVVEGPRRHQWIASLPASILWVEALDGGDPKAQAEHRDQVFVSAAPFESSAPTLKLQHRFSAWQATEADGAYLVSEYDRDRRWSTTWGVEEKDGKIQTWKIWDRSIRDRYQDPGRPVSTRNQFGQSVAMLRDEAMWLTGRGASPEGDRPFIRQMNFRTLEEKTLWRCEGECYESVLDVLSDDGTKILTSYESPSEPPNTYLRDLQQGTRRNLTQFEDPAPQLRQIKKQLVTYERDDGVLLSATLYLPPDYRQGERRPLMVWAYPREYNDPKTAGQISGSPYRFTRMGGTSHLFLLTQGYVIMDAATMPVVGDAETMNDTFIEQIVASAQAAIDTAAEMGVADPERVGVGGHSYGAFMTANLLAHCDLFKAGIARSGAYNRSLTPFGFQSERRTFWEAPMTYFKVSPFMHANKINEPILLVHGQIDNNSGTFPIQSERMYHAIKGHGGKARLCMLPYESHGYRGKESVYHVLAEMVRWMDVHVKGTITSD